MSVTKNKHRKVLMLWWTTSKIVHPPIIKEVRRWSNLLWDDYLDYKYRKNRQSDVDNPLGL